MMPAKFIVFALLFVTCSYASPLRMATMYGSFFAVPIFIEDFDATQAAIDEEPIYLLNDDSNNKIENDTENSFDVEKRSIEETNDNDNDLETAAGTNLLRPLFVYRQQVAYRQRARDAIRRGRRI
ncbi:uncharacterized protein LOC126857681 [Cataglyphis hispanica]|uniref:uncharacterized protein LOC126857681 n=1 Tax=Cataglyphis hispanica TaxID=1086592 RepID=UPI00217F6BDA|nr:uncharacterized protein LOC126857681 [Cataglyphis hispanica]